MFNNSILLTVMKRIGPSAEYPDFRQELIDWINTNLSTLTEIGVGPSEGFMIQDETDVWSDFVEPIPKWSPVITYISSKAKLQFDPPIAGTALEALKECIKEDEWRLTFRAEQEAHNV